MTTTSVDSVVLDIEGNRELEAVPRWLPDHKAAPIVRKSEDGAWTEVAPTGRGAVGAGDGSAELDEFLMLGLYVKENVVVDTKIRLRGGFTMDRVGLAVRAGRDDWMWGGLAVVDHKVCMSTAGRIDGRAEMSFHGEWDRKRPLHVRLYRIGPDCVIEFGKLASSAGLDIASMYSNMTDADRVTYEFVRICRVRPEGSDGPVFVGLYLSDHADSSMTASLSGLRMRPCKSYSHQAQDS